MISARRLLVLPQQEPELPLARRFGRVAVEKSNQRRSSASPASSQLGSPSNAKVRSPSSSRSQSSSRDDPEHPERVDAFDHLEGGRMGCFVENSSSPSRSSDPQAGHAMGGSSSEGMESRLRSSGRARGRRRGALGAAAGLSPPTRTSSSASIGGRAKSESSSMSMSGDATGRRRGAAGGTTVGRFRECWVTTGMANSMAYLLQCIWTRSQQASLVP
mmetsp:Transcript_42634/g.112887  ORF Transcript_42634/g.112887 Transcript_42634/m.112887 type:complete len:217 (-) Transcript_42634:3-653(-)